MKPLSHGHGSLYACLAVLAAHAIHGLIEVDEGFRIFQQVDLVSAVHQTTQPYSHQSDQHPSFIQFVEQFLHHADEGVIRRSIGNAHLPGMGLEIGVAQLNGHHRSELVLLAQLVSQLLCHGDENVAQLLYIGSIAVKGLFGRYGFAFGIGFYRRAVHAVGLLPDAASVLSQYILHDPHGHVLHGRDAHDAHTPEGLGGALAHHRYLAYCQRCEKGFLRAVVHLDLVIGLGLTRSHFGYGLVLR